MTLFLESTPAPDSDPVHHLIVKIIIIRVHHDAGYLSRAPRIESQIIISLVGRSLLSTLIMKMSLFLVKAPALAPDPDPDHDHDHDAESLSLDGSRSRSSSSSSGSSLSSLLPLSLLRTFSFFNRQSTVCSLYKSE
jgi:hypothetical protein